MRTTSENGYHFVFGPEWPGEQYNASKCTTKRLLDLLAAAASCLLSLTAVGIRYYHDARCRHISFESEPTSRTRLLPGRASYASNSPLPNRVRISRPMKSLEIVILAIIVSTDAACLVHHEQCGSAISLSASVYLLALALAQCLGHGAAITRLQPHSMALYAAQIVCTAVLLPLAFPDHPDRQNMYTYYFIRIWLFIGLFAIHGLAPRARQHPLHGDDSAPTGAQERASLFSLLGFSWVTELLLEAFRVGSLDAARLDPLGRAQTSDLVVAGYDESNQKMRHAGLLWQQIFRFLRRDILQQGLWAIVASVAVFMPPLLIKLVPHQARPRVSRVRQVCRREGLFLSLGCSSRCRLPGWRSRSAGGKAAGSMLSSVPYCSAKSTGRYARG